MSLFYIGKFNLLLLFELLTLLLVYTPHTVPQGTLLECVQSCQIIFCQTCITVKNNLRLNFDLKYN